jgi:hypothetical protein
MTLDQVVIQLNQEHDYNYFTTSLEAAKRHRENEGEWVIARFQNKYNWKDFTSFQVTLYETIPVGWPLSDVAKRLNCSMEELDIIACYTNRKWHHLVY